MKLTTNLSRFVFGLTRGFLKLDYGNWSYSQEGEDLIISGFFEDEKTGFYVDVGALHPRRFSNTHRLYRRGWRGINIDPTPGSMELFRSERPRDINLEIGVSSGNDDLTLYRFAEPALNTLSKQVADEQKGNSELISAVEIESKTLREILGQYLPEDTAIDILDIDVEGYDFDVLKSNDWDRFRPRVVLVESMNVYDMLAAAESEMPRYLSARNYCLVSKTRRTLIFVEKRFLASI